MQLTIYLDSVESHLHGKLCKNSKAGRIQHFQVVPVPMPEVIIIRTTNLDCEIVYPTPNIPNHQHPIPKPFSPGCEGLLLRRLEAPEGVRSL